MLFASDHKEVSTLLSELGMSSGSSKEDVAILEDVKRFRRSRGLDGPDFITLSDLYALRIENGDIRGSKKILPYVLWASSVGGGRAIVRPQYKPEIETPIIDATTESKAEDVISPAPTQVIPEGSIVD